MSIQSFWYYSLSTPIIGQFTTNLTNLLEINVIGQNNTNVQNILTLLPTGSSINIVDNYGLGFDLRTSGPSVVALGVASIPVTIVTTVGVLTPGYTYVVNISSYKGVVGTLPITSGGTSSTSFTTGNFVNYDGTSLVSTKVVPVGGVVGTSDIQGLTNKTLTDVTNACRATTLREMVVDATVPIANQVLKSTGATTSAYTLYALSTLNDVTVAAPNWGQLITYDTDVSKFKNSVVVWQDLLGNVSFRAGGGGNAPVLNVFRGLQYEYSCNTGLTYAYFTYHIPHDYLIGSDIFIHVHQGSNTADVGTVLWTVTSSLAKIGSAFNVDVTAPVISHTGFTQYVHYVDEVLFATAGGSATAQDTANIDVDTIISVRVDRNTAAVGDTAGAANIFLFQVDLHYQSDSRVGTKNKAPPFNV